MNPLAWLILLNEPAGLLEVFIKEISLLESLLDEVQVLGERDEFVLLDGFLLLIVVSAKLLRASIDHFFPSVVIQDLKEGLLLLFG